MAKNFGRIAPYEMVDKARFKSAQQKVLSSIIPLSSKSPLQQVEQPPAVESLPQVSEKIAAVPAEPPPRKIGSKKADSWSKRPKAIRIYPDRVELCISWQVLMIGLLALSAVVLVFFRFGQIYSLKKTQPKKAQTASISVEKIMPQVKTERPVLVSNAEQKPKMVEPMGDHIIVIASHDLSSRLEPAKQYFAGFGIATQIIKKANKYMLVTQERFNNPEKTGSDGFEMKKKIISIGAGYKPSAASGYEPFGAKPFQDAYGMKVN